MMNRYVPYTLNECKGFCCLYGKHKFSRSFFECEKLTESVIFYTLSNKVPKVTREFLIVVLSECIITVITKSHNNSYYYS